jgi:hypothetical protein
MFVTHFTAPGNPAKANEDWVAASGDTLIVLDGATVRTETGCRHNVAWYTGHLGRALVAAAGDPDVPLTDGLRQAITSATARHSDTCDLSHPGSPSAGVGIVRVGEAGVEYLVLGDVTLLIETPDGNDFKVQAISDQRISQSARAEREEVDRHLIGTPEKEAALIPMKLAELAARNTDDGYWIASTNPDAAGHAITGTLSRHEVVRLALLSDGAARLVDLFGAYSWRRMLDTIEAAGLPYVVQQVRELEAKDELGKEYPRNKVSDDATILFADPHKVPTRWTGARPGRTINHEVDFDSPEVQATRAKTLAEFVEFTSSPGLTGQDIAAYKARQADTN